MRLRKETVEAVWSRFFYQKPQHRPALGTGVETIRHRLRAANLGIMVDI